MPTTTAIIPTYNREAFIGACLKAILSQSRAVEQIIVVNDGSCDGTSDIVSALGSRVSLIEIENQGKSRALNLALSKAAGDYIWVVDDDDLVRPDAHDILARVLDSQAAVDLAYGLHDRFREDPDTGERTSIGTGYWTTCHPDAFFVSTLEDLFVHQPGTLVRRSLYRRIGGYNETLKRSVDYEMLIRQARHGKVQEVDGVVFDQRIHQGDRGSSDFRFAANDRNDVWIEHDMAILETCRTELSLGEYLIGSRTIENELDQRQALLQRATIMARKQLWDHAASDWEAAARLALPPLARDEILTIRRCSGSKYGPEALFAQTALPGFFRDLSRVSPVGAEVSRAFSRSLLWPIRKSLSEMDVLQTWNRAAYWLELARGV
ncbi:MAG: glycosyltransferase [Hyphomonas sp.]